MKENNTYSNPFIRTRDTTERVMLDVVIALLPSLFMAYWAFGVAALSLVAVSVGSALVAEFLYSLLFNRRLDTLHDGSAVVTGFLLAFTVGAFTPLPVVSFGAAAAVVFGKLLWGGLGRNVFNPALVGREFMTVFFPSVMTSGAIWYRFDAVNHTALSLTGHSLIDELLFKSSGAVGEYSIACLTLGGLYLLLRRRISWHIPFCLLAVFTLSLCGMRLLGAEDLSFSLGGVILGAVFMATDMPSSASTPAGRCYYGAMIGLTAALFILLGLRYEYMSYSILLLNGATPFIDRYIRPRVWGMASHPVETTLHYILLTVAILAVAVVIGLCHSFLTPYLVYVFILYLTIRRGVAYIKAR